MMRLAVSLARQPYESVIESGALSQTGALVGEVLRPGPCALITDANVGPLYADAATRSLTEAGFAPVVLTIGAGEESKSLGTRKPCVIK